MGRLLLAPGKSRDENGPVAPTLSGGVLVVPGQYGNAWQIAEATTNLFINPRVTNTTGWLDNASIDREIIAVGSDLPGIDTAIRYTFLATYVNGINSPLVAINGSTTYTVSFYVRGVGQTVGKTFSHGVYGGGGWKSMPIPSVVLTDTWKRVSATITTAASDTYIFALPVLPTSAAGDVIDMTGFQIEQKAYATPYCDGSLGAGHAWTGTPHASTSTRAAASVAVPNSYINSERGTAVLRFNREPGQHVNGGYVLNAGQWGTRDLVALTINTNGSGTGYFNVAPTSVGATFPAGTFAVGDTETVALVWDGANVKAQTLDISVSNTRPARSGSFHNTTMTLGHPSQGFNGAVESALFFDTALTDAEIERISTMAHWTWGNTALDYSPPPRFVPYRSPGSFGFNVDLWRVRRDASRIERVDPEAYGSMTIVCNQDTAVKRSISIVTSDLNLFVPFQDYLMPVLTISDPEGNTISGPQGVFMVTPPNTNTNKDTSQGTVEGRDLFQLFVMDTSPQGWAPPETDRGELVRAAVSEYGFGLGQVQIPDFGSTLSEYKTWDPGATVADRITDLAVSSNWYQPWFALNGTLVTKPYGPLTGLSPSISLSNRDNFSAADIEGIIVGTPDWGRLANRVTVRKIGSQDEPSIWWTQADQNSDSPVSFKNLGVWIGKVVDNPDLETEEQAKTQAQSLLSESASHYLKLSVPTFPVIDAELHQTVELDIWHGNEPLYTGSYWRTGYTLTLDGSKTKMVQELARVEPWE